MSRAFLPLLLSPLLLTAPAADAASGELLRALSDEMKRTVERLEMKKLDKPYFVSYSVRDVRRISIESSFGAIKDPHEYRSRQLKVDLRVGGRTLDNAHYVGKDHWSYRPLTGPLALDDDYDALRYGTWSLTDKAYKQALQRLAQKKAYKQDKLITEEIPDLSEEQAQSFEEPAADLAFDHALWESRMRKLSSIFKKYPAIQSSEVDLYWTQRYTYFVDSEGRRVIKPDHDFEIYMSASTQAEDGMRLGDRRRFISKTRAGIPLFSELETGALRLAKDLTALAKAPALDKPYIGPVMIEGQAAGEFFDQLLAHNISFPRELWVEQDSVKEQFHSGSLAGRLGLRVLSPLLNVVDDPSLEDAEGKPLIGHYSVDDEGIPAQKVTLIERGILKDLLMSRSPTKERERSNGHGRAAFWEHTTARISNLVIDADKTVPEDELKQAFLREAKEFGLDFGLIVRRIAEEDRQEKDEVLAAPVMLYKVDVSNGREELVRGARFTGVSMRALRDVLAAGDRRHVYNYYQLGPYKSSRGQVQASIVHPSVLLGEMELKKTDKKPDKLPYLKHPHFD
ncbi:MAG: metallopeptidase TldD-related protein [Elusimicrobiota bacterium]